MQLNYLYLLAFMALLVACEQPDENNSGFNDVESVQMEVPESHKIGEFAVGVQAWTFHRFTLMEAIEKTAATGANVIELFPGQEFSPEDDTPFAPQNASDEMIREVRDSLEAHDLIPVNFGVVGLPDEEEETRQVFEFADKLGVQAITSEPDEEALDLIEEMVQEYDIMLAIHNHPPDFGDDDYMLWDPEHVRSMVEGRDGRMGVSADVGHWIRSDIDPVEALRILEGRIVSVHFTDVDQFGLEGEDVIIGTGAGNMPGILDELKRQNFGGNISIEYETNWYDNVTDVAQFVGYIRGWDQTRKTD